MIRFDSFDITPDGDYRHLLDSCQLQGWAYNSSSLPYVDSTPTVPFLFLLRRLAISILPELAEAKILEIGRKMAVVLHKMVRD